MTFPHLESEILEAIKILQSRIETITIDDPSLLSGLGGKTLFYSYLAKSFTKSEQYETAVGTLEEIFSQLEKVSSLSSFAEGFSGIAWLLQHLYKENLIEDIPESQIAYFDEPIFQTLHNHYRNKNYDPLYGAVGCGLYFLERESACFNSLKELIAMLNKLSSSDNFFVPWQDSLASPEGIETPNLGLSHGLAGINLFLCNALNNLKQNESNPNNQDSYHLTKKMLRESIDWLIDHQLPFGHSLFPNNAGVNEESRLGWSYGDLGIAFCLIKAGVILEDKVLTKKGADIASFTLKRDISNAQLYFDHHHIPDAGICNGSAGIACLYQNIYSLTHQDIFKERAEYWLIQTLDAVRESYKIYGLENVNVHQTHWWNDAGLIKGLPGIGLSLLSFLDVNAQNWKKAFLI